MKKLHILFFFFLFCFLHDKAKAQSLEIAAGQNFMPGDYISLRYESSPDYTLTLAVKGFYERSRSHSLNYSAIGIDLLAVYPMQFLRLGLGPTIHFENEPWVYQGWSFSKRLNYGIAAEASLNWDLSDNIGLTTTLQQKFLLSGTLGHTRLNWSIGLKYTF